MDNIFTVTSGKGGVGKTTTAIHLAVAVGSADRPVVVVDADLGMADVGTFLDLDPVYTLHDILSGNASIESALSEIAPGVDALAGSRDLGSFPDADPDELGSVIDRLAEQYAFVFIDTGGGLSYEAALPLELADAVVLVTSPQPAAIDNTKKSKQLADRVGVSVAGVVVTHANERTDSAAIADETGVPLLGSVPADPVIPESTERCQSLFEYAPDSEAMAAYRRIGAALVEETEAPEGETEHIHVNEPVDNADEASSPDSTPERDDLSTERERGEKASESSVESDEVAGADEVDDSEDVDQVDDSEDVDQVDDSGGDDHPAETSESDNSDGSAADTPEETNEPSNDTESTTDQGTGSAETRRSGGFFSRLFGWLR